MLDHTDFVRRFALHTGEAPDAPAIVDKGHTWSRADVWRAANVLADELRMSGVVPGRPVAVWSPKSAATITALIACAIAKVPAMVPSVDLPEGVVADMAAAAGCTHRISVESAAPGPAGLEPRVEKTGSVGDDRLSGVPLILATSGSTGMPKIVPSSPGGVREFFGWASAAFEITAGRRVLSYAPLNFDLSLLDVWTTLWAGGTVVLVDPAGAADPAYLRSLLADHDVEIVQVVPMFVQMVVGADQTFPSVTQLIVTGDVLRPTLLPSVRAAFPNARVHNLYGCTETNDSVIHELDSFDPARSDIPIGRPIPGVHAVLVDAAGDELDGPAVGELLVSTPFQTAGYLDETLTATRFVTRELAGRPHRFYRTGDVVRRDAEGLLYLLGRDDFHVKVRGVRTNMQEVEHVLRRHTGVVEVAVVAIPDEAAGHRLHATLQVDAAAGVNGLRLRSHCAAVLPRTAIPSSFDLRTAPLPRTTTGKVDRNAVRAALQ